MPLALQAVLHGPCRYSDRCRCHDALPRVAPFGFHLDLANDDVSVWRLPHSGHKMIYLTFDDGPNPEVTPPLLDLLRRKGIRAIFFLIDEHLNEATAPFRYGHRE